MHILMIGLPILAALVILVIFVLWILTSFRKIGPNEVGLVTKKISFKKLPEGSIIAFAGEAGYQAELLMPGLRFKLRWIYSVKTFPWVQVPANAIGAIIAQIGSDLPAGMKTAPVPKSLMSTTKEAKASPFVNLQGFIGAGGFKGVQRYTLLPGTTMPVHPIGFLVVTSDHVYGQPIDESLAGRGLSAESWGLKSEDFLLTRIEGTSDDPKSMRVGIVTVLDGPSLTASEIASRLNGFDDISALENALELKRSAMSDDVRTELEKRKTDTSEDYNESQIDKIVSSRMDAQVIELLLKNSNASHDSFQDFQKFIELGGKMGLQHDPLPPGVYALNPFLVKVEKLPITHVKPGEVAVVRSGVGLETQDTSGVKFKFGSLVRPGHRGVWRSTIGVGIWMLNARIYQIELVKTAILTLNWATAVSTAHDLDSKLSAIAAKSKEGFDLSVDVQCQIHVADTVAPQLIMRVGNLANLVEQVLMPIVGNHFREALQALPVVTFIESRDKIQVAAHEHISARLREYDIECPGIYIQDVRYPEQITTVLKEREVANQQQATYKMEQKAEEVRSEKEQAKATADMQQSIVNAELSIKVNTSKSQAKIAEAEGEAGYKVKIGKATAEADLAIGTAKATVIEKQGTAQGVGYKSQVDALGQHQTMIVNAVKAISEGNLQLPQVIVVGNGGSIEGLAASLIQKVSNSQATREVIPPKDDSKGTWTNKK